MLADTDGGAEASITGRETFDCTYGVMGELLPLDWRNCNSGVNSLMSFDGNKVGERISADETSIPGLVKSHCVALSLLILCFVHNATVTAMIVTTAVSASTSESVESHPRFLLSFTKRET